MKPKNIFIIGLMLNLLIGNTVLGNIGANEEAEDSDIFPFSSGRTIDYTEDFYEITDEGIYDENGNTINVIEADEEADTENKPPEEKSEQANIEAYQATIINNWGNKKTFTKKRLDGIKENLKSEMVQFVELEKQINQINKDFAPIQKEINSLKDQIDALNDQLKASKQKISSTELQIAEKEIDLKTALLQMKEMEARLKIQQKAVLDYIELVYQEEEKFLDYRSQSSSALKLLLADNSVSENLMGLEYSKVLEEAGRKVFYELHNQKLTLEEKKSDIEEEKNELNQLYQGLKNEKKILEEGKASKKDILEKTLGEERRYQELLERSIQQQLESAIAIQNMKDNISFIESKLDILEESNPNTQPAISNNETTPDQKIEEESVYSQLPQLETVPEETQFEWPVPPVAVTAEFHDEHYPKKWGMHNAVDLRAKQFTEIKAPANGYVFQTKDNGLGYSYIILAHKNNLVTVYGHVSEILVKSGTLVKQGDVIGLSGGTPGTKGAGLQTTGPHLHFEVWKNGAAVDPLDYLPVFELPIEYIPDRFLSN